MRAATTGRVTFRDVLRVSEFRSLWLADAQSMAGDQLARVALSVLVFDRTGSPALTALVYALSFLPAIVGGALLSGLADRLPRRSVMVGCDVLRAVLIGLMVIPQLPLWSICTLLVASILVGRAFTSAEIALIPDMLAGDAYPVGSGLRMMTSQIAQLVGFACGGVAISVIGARGGLAVDAVTFGISAVVVRLTIRHRPAAVRPGEAGPSRASLWHSASAGVRLIAADPRLRTLACLGWLAAFHIVPEGIAAPYAHAIGGGATAVGLLMAAMPAGSALGAFLIVRVREDRRSATIGPLAIAAGLPLIACLTKPDLPMSILLWVLAGLFTGYQVQASASFVRAVPDERRGQVVGLAASALLAIQGVGVLAFGIIADHLGAATSVAFAGIVSAALAIPLAVGWTRIRRHNVPLPSVPDRMQDHRLTEPSHRE